MKITRIETLRLPEHPHDHLGPDPHVGRPWSAWARPTTSPVPWRRSSTITPRRFSWGNRPSTANGTGRPSSPTPTSSATRGPRCGRCRPLDIALWDLLGQYLGQPIYNLIGGRCRESIPIYNTCVNTPKYADQDAFLKRPGELARSLLDQGIRQMKVWPWDRFAPQLQFAHDTGPAGWTAVGPPGNYLSARGS